MVNESRAESSRSAPCGHGQQPVDDATRMNAWCKRPARGAMQQKPGGTYHIPNRLQAFPGPGALRARDHREPRRAGP